MFLISAPTSASGKTTVSRALMAALTRRGKVVQPFKCGPDFIDTKFHEAVCHRPSINLDPFMATPEHLCQLFSHYSSGADISIVEGMMGLFDGYSRDKGSTADIAAILNIPGILVVNAQSAAYSLAALLSGFVNFRSDITIAGVIFNKVGSPRHFSMLQEICQDLSLTCFGYLPKDPSVEQASRYLGLDFSQTVSDEALNHLVELAERCIDIPKLSTLNPSPIAFHSSLFTLHSIQLSFETMNPFPSSTPNTSTCYAMPEQSRSLTQNQTNQFPTTLTSYTCRAAIQRNMPNNSHKRHGPCALSVTTSNVVAKLLQNAEE